MKQFEGRLYGGKLFAGRLFRSPDKREPGFVVPLGGVALKPKRKRRDNDDDVLMFLLR